MARGCLTVSTTVRESMIHIIEPVATEVINFIVEKMGYVEQFKDNIEVVSDFRSTSKTTDANHNANIRHDRVRAKINPNVNPSSLKWEGNGQTIDLGNGNQLITNPHATTSTRTPWKRPSYPDQEYNVFADNDNYITLTDRLIGSQITIEMNMEFKHATDAQEALSRVFQCFTNGEMVHSIDLQYDYPVPLELQHVLKYLYSLRGPRALPDGKEDSCLRWILDGSNGQITIKYNRNDPRKAELVVNRNHFETIFQIECSQEAPTPLSPDGFGVNLNVTVQYARANTMVLQYPIVVNNQFVAIEYVPMDPQYRDDQSTPASLIMWENPAFTGFWLSMYARDQRPYVYPWYDPWEMPRDSHPGAHGFKPLVTCAFELDDIDNPDGYTELDLIEGLPGITLSQEIQDILMREKRNALDIEGIVNVSVFADDWVMDESLLEFDGRILKVKKRGRRSTCRLVISARNMPIGTANPGKRVWLTTIHPVKWETYKSSRMYQIPQFGIYTCSNRFRKG